MPANGPEPTEPRCATRRWLVLAIALAAVLQAGATLRARAIAKDGITFINVARRLPQDPLRTIRSADQHPGYPAMILVSHALVGRFLTRDEPRAWAASAHLATWACGLLGVVGCWLFARRVFNAHVAGVSALLLAAMPALRQNAADGLSDAPHVLFFVLACWMAAEGFARWRCWWFAGAGAASGMAYLIRPEGLSVAVAAGAALAILALRRQGPRLRTVLLALVALAAATGAAAAPYMLIKGHLTTKKNPLRILLSVLNVSGTPDDEPLTQKSPPASHGPVQRKSGPPVSGGQPPPAQRGDKPGTPAATAPGAGHEAPPGPSSRLEAITTLLAGMADTLRLTLLLPLGVGILVSRRLKAQPQASLMALLLVGLYALVMFGLQMAVGYMSERHLLPLAALAVPWVGAGTLCLADRLHGGLQQAAVRMRHSAQGRVASPPVLARRRATGQCPSSRWVLYALVAIMLLEQSRSCLHPLHKRHEPALKAASWVRAHANDGEAVLSNSWYVAFYSGLPGLRIDTPERLAGLLARRGSSRYRYFVLETCEGTGTDPAWLTLLQAHYREVAVETLGQRWKVIIFEARKPGKG